MRKIDNLIQEYRKKTGLILEQPPLPPMDPMATDPMATGGLPPADAMGMAMAPGPIAPPVPEKKTLTSEGKKFLIELILHALAIDPDDLTQGEKSIFDEEITIENADDLLEKLRNIIDEHGTM